MPFFIAIGFVVILGANMLQPHVPYTNSPMEAQSSSSYGSAPMIYRDCVAGTCSLKYTHGEKGSITGEASASSNIGSASSGY